MSEVLFAYSQSRTARIKNALYQHVIEGNTLPLIESITEALIATERPDHEQDLSHHLNTSRVETKRPSTIVVTIRESTV